MPTQHITSHDRLASSPGNRTTDTGMEAMPHRWKWTVQPMVLNRHTHTRALCSYQALLTGTTSTVVHNNPSPPRQHNTESFQAVATTQHNSVVLCSSVMCELGRRSTVASPPPIQVSLLASSTPLSLMQLRDITLISLTKRRIQPAGWLACKHACTCAVCTHNTAGNTRPQSYTA